MDNFKELTLESDVFEDARNKFNGVLQKLFKSMVDAKSDEGSLTLKIDVEMITNVIPNTSAEVESNEREIHVPRFSYKVSSQVAVKNEQKGINSPEMELVYDADKMAYVLQYIANTEQQSIFDEQYVEDEAEEFAEEIDEENLIEGSSQYLIGKEDDENA